VLSRLFSTLCLHAGDLSLQSANGSDKRFPVSVSGCYRMPDLASQRSFSRTDSDSLPTALCRSILWMLQKFLHGVLSTRVLKELLPSINLLFNFGQLQSHRLFSAHAIICSATSGEKSLWIHVDDADITAKITLHSSNLFGCELSFMGTRIWQSILSNKY
jgi:hypothetical protein